MSQAYYNGLSGLVSFSKGLDQVSNNISNMNTAGFRGKDVFYESVTGDAGSKMGGEAFRSQQGDIQNTGNDTDLAISGEGFFVLIDGDKQYLTRAGQFYFDESYQLIDRVTGANVAGIDENGRLVDIDLSDHLSLPPQVTTSITLAGNLSADGEEHTISDVEVYSSTGESLIYTFEFSDRRSVMETLQDENGVDYESPTGESSWTLTVIDNEGNEVLSSEVRYSSDGTSVEGFDQASLTLTDDSEVVISFTGTTSYATGDTSGMSASVEDGYGLAALTNVSFDGDGILQVTYSNGEELDTFKVALANINDEKYLTPESGALFSVNESGQVRYGYAGSGEFGTIEGESLELANVDLADEFSDMMIIQRGYQASSKVMTVADELIETLYNSTR